MRPESYSRWVDPAPLEIERPRLPWWTLLPRKLLLALSPLILTAVLVGAVVFLARRVWRYPLFLMGAAVLVGLGVGYSWWASAGLLGGLGAGCGWWAWQYRSPSPGSRSGRCAQSGVGRWSTPSAGPPPDADQP